MIKHTTFFTVYPEDCNYHIADSGRAMIHGGTMLLKMDRAVAECVRLNTPLKALTVGVDNVCFDFGASLGDFIELEVEIVEVGIKRITCKVTCWLRQDYAGEGSLLIASGRFHFCTFQGDKSHPHGLKCSE